jgi:hypothetical protein
VWLLSVFLLAALGCMGWVLYAVLIDPISTGSAYLALVGYVLLQGATYYVRLVLSLQMFHQEAQSSDSARNSSS